VVTSLRTTIQRTVSDKNKINGTNNTHDFNENEKDNVTHERLKGGVDCDDVTPDGDASGDHDEDDTNCKQVIMPTA
jgi:hypothetical protein